MRGELLALRWQNVDLGRATIRVEHSLEQTSTGLRFKSPKSKYGRRVISLPHERRIDALSAPEGATRISHGSRHGKAQAGCFGVLQL